MPIFRAPVNRRVDHALYGAHTPRVRFALLMSIVAERVLLPPPPKKRRPPTQAEWNRDNQDKDLESRQGDYHLTRVTLRTRARRGAHRRAA